MHHCERDFAHVRLEATSADTAKHRGVIQDQHLGARPPVS